MLLALSEVVADTAAPGGDLCTWKAHNWNRILFCLLSFTQRDVAEESPALFSMKQKPHHHSFPKLHPKEFGCEKAAVADMCLICSH